MVRVGVPLAALLVLHGLGYHPVDGYWFERGARFSSGRIVNILDYGAVANASDLVSATSNAAAINAALANLTAGDTLVVPEMEFYALGGIAGYNLTDVVVQFRGTLRALADFDHWPYKPSSGNDGDYLDFFELHNASHVTIEGTPGSEIDGMGKPWWNAFILGKLSAHHRPKLVGVKQSSNVLVRNLFLHDSPSFHLIMSGIAETEVANITIETDRKDIAATKDKWRKLGSGSSMSTPDLDRDGDSFFGAGGEPGLEPIDLNTDGIDPSGRDVWIHDCHILNDDDSIAVKPCNSGDGCAFSNCSENMLIEDLTLTGFGASIGSVPPHPDGNCVRNVTFRRLEMPQTGKGVYVKSNPQCQPGSHGIIADIVYKDINIIEPSWWPIWIGPQQQHEPNEALGRKCALIYPIDDHCPTQGCVTFDNITLENIYVEHPALSPGVILGNASNPMTNINFINVTVTNPGYFPFKRNYQCQNVELTITESSPVPSCTKGKGR